MNFGVVEFAIIAGIVIGFLACLRWLARPRRSADPEQAALNEQEILRQLFAQMNKMEQRLENLETILLEKDAARK